MRKRACPLQSAKLAEHLHVWALFFLSTWQLLWLYFNERCGKKTIQGASKTQFKRYGRFVDDQMPIETNPLVCRLRQSKQRLNVEPLCLWIACLTNPAGNCQESRVSHHPGFSRFRARSFNSTLTSTNIPNPHLNTIQQLPLIISRVCFNTNIFAGLGAMIILRSPRRLLSHQPSTVYAYSIWNMMLLVSLWLYLLG